MDLNNSFSNLFILFLLFACPVFCTGRLKSEIYEIDYRGPETHSYMPPPQVSGVVDINGGLQRNQEAHGRSKWPYTENTTNMWALFSSVAMDQLGKEASWMNQIQPWRLQTSRDMQGNENLQTKSFENVSG